MELMGSNVTRKISLHIAATFAGLIAMYLSGAFVKWDWLWLDVQNWTAVDRAGLLFMGTCAFVITNALFHFYLEGVKC